MFKDTITILMVSIFSLSIVVSMLSHAIVQCWGSLVVARRSVGRSVAGRSVLEGGMGGGTGMGFDIIPPKISQHFSK